MIFSQKLTDTPVDPILSMTMLSPNQTVVTEFVLEGFSEHPGLRLFLTGCFLTLYIMALMGNILIIALVTSSTGLHNPMYFFLCNLATTDIVCTSSVIPKALVGLVSEENTISFKGCMSQLFFLTWSASSELLLLTVMAYDRYVAICFPLHYTSIMSPKLCVSLVVLSWVFTILYSMLHTLLLARLSFCEDNVITHFFCDISALLKLACSDIYINEVMIFIFEGLDTVIPFLLIVVSYVQIVCSILKFSSTRGIAKIFSTCGSHLSVVSLFYGTIIGLYLCPSTNNSTVKDTAMAMMYTVVTPMLNPFIYSLRNKDMKEALIRVLCKKEISL
ncbi:hypothetical protein FDP56_18110 [Enterococcus casseliflavus]|nr:hypothetical protein [Enterococcus casseliflavus]